MCKKKTYVQALPQIYHHNKSKHKIESPKIRDLSVLILFGFGPGQISSHQGKGFSHV
jgi:hypothetical protein